ncbi:cyclin-dependent kinase 2-interacting protein isoform X1 [Sturnira hondurensis]|uniref:cyclin-dependent kinase 2-interacting protein isoform X1 n=1 Tax=Sturnira hondurensis TaxID=192404 RepID=UPI00187A9494|nr:cyclin-dependent kinase 2-interacting protein isoform X1 [Sturnira hondurensis]
MEAKTLGSATPRKPVLSVSARKIKDNAADWHNLILKWETLNDAGFAIANNIANTKISLLSKDEAELESSSPACDGNAEQRPPGYSAELEALCEELRATVAGLTKIQVKMEKLSSTTKGICELERYHHGEDGRRPPLFHTWPTARFGRLACYRRGCPPALGHVPGGAPPETHHRRGAGAHHGPQPHPDLPVPVAAPALRAERQQAASGEHAARNGAPSSVTCHHGCTHDFQAPPAPQASAAPAWTSLQVGPTPVPQCHAQALARPPAHLLGSSRRDPFTSSLRPLQTHSLTAHSASCVPVTHEDLGVK